MRPLLLLALVASAALADEAPPAPGTPPPPPPLKPVGITISGGVSLGSWEAGFMYLWLEAQKARPQAEVRIVTGASAGSANALVSAISSCLPPTPNPMDDLGWQAWGPVGFQQLFDRSRARDSLFVRDPLEQAMERVREVWNRGLPESCDVAVGASVTRVQPRQIMLKEGLTVPRALETFTVRIQGRGPGKPPKLSNLVDPYSPTPVPLLVLRDDDSPETDIHNFNQLRQVVFASAAFPAAFEPVPINYCLSKPSRRGKPGDTRCFDREHTDLFFDGGVFDNNPLRTSWATAERFLRSDEAGATHWRAPLSRAPEGEPVTVEHVYLDPDTEVYPAEPATAVEQTGFLARVFSLSGGILESARARELGQLATEREDLSEHLHLAMSNLPKASEHLNAFVGFFERDFRVFDFYLGMYDAFVELNSKRTWEGEAVDFEQLAAKSDDSKRGWAPFFCLLSQLEPKYARLASQCEGESLANFRVLLQVSLDRLYQRCKPVPGKGAPLSARPHHHCALAAEGARPPQVPGVKVLPAEQLDRGPTEARFDYFMRLLDAYEFRFVDLRQGREAADDGRLALRQELDQVVDVWSQSQQSFADQTVSKTLGRTALNAIAFSPPTISGYVTVGTTLQTGMSLVPHWRPRWLQLTGSLGFGLIETLFGQSRTRLTTTLSLGPEFHLTPISGAVVQPRVALRTGVQFGAFDGWGGRGCVDAVDARDCTQGVLEVAGVLTFFERLRVQGVWQTFPRLYGRQDFFHLQFGIGFQFL